MIESYITTIRNGHHYVDMNPSKTVKEVYFMVGDGEHYEQYKESHAHDLKSTMGTKAIEIMKRVE